MSTTEKLGNIGTALKNKAGTAVQMSQQDEALHNIGTFLVQRKDKIATALPKHVTADRMIRVTMNTLQKSPDLLRCTVPSLWEAIIEAATYGWDIGGPVAQAYLVPFNVTIDQKTKRTEKRATLIPGYRGLMDLARRSGQVANVAAECVHEGDLFEVSDDPLNPEVRFQKSTDKDRHTKPITHVFAGYLLTNDQRVYHVMTAAEIDAHKERYAKGWRKADSAWQTSWDSMAKKTVLKRPIMDGRVPIASEHQRMLQRDEYDRNSVDGSVASRSVTPAPQGALTSSQDVLPPPSDDGGTEWELFCHEAATRVSDAKNVTEVNAVVEALNNEYVGDDHAAFIFEIAESRREEIRDDRGPRSNSK